VSHCYQRRTAAGWPYSLYTMIHSRNKKECLACIQRMARAAKLSEYQVLFTLKEYKKSKMELKA
jgi:hypothetical protein